MKGETTEGRGRGALGGRRDKGPLLGHGGLGLQLLSVRAIRRPCS